MKADKITNRYVRRQEILSAIKAGLPPLPWEGRPHERLVHGYTDFAGVHIQIITRSQPHYGARMYVHAQLWDEALGHYLGWQELTVPAESANDYASKDELERAGRALCEKVLTRWAARQSYRR